MKNKILDFCGYSVINKSTNVVFQISVANSHISQTHTKQDCWNPLCVCQQITVIGRLCYIYSEAIIPEKADQRYPPVSPVVWFLTSTFPNSQTNTVLLAANLMSIKYFLMFHMTGCTFRAAATVSSHVFCNYNDQGHCCTV